MGKHKGIQECLTSQERDASPQSGSRPSPQSLNVSYMTRGIKLVFVCLVPGVIWAEPPFAPQMAADNIGLVVLHELEPSLLSTDLNGDGKNDAVLFVKDRKTRKKGLCLVHNGSKECVVIGAGKKFSHVGDDFSWVSHWEIVPPGETWETTFKPDGDVLGQKRVVLDNAGVRLCVDEGGCGVISLRRGGYAWIHQAD